MAHRLPLADMTPQSQQSSSPEEEQGVSQESGAMPSARAGSLRPQPASQSSQSAIPIAGAGPHNCPHCQNGWFGGDLECVNGVVIDIDEAHEGAADVVHPVAPCHPLWERQQADPDGETWHNDSIERLNEWRATGAA